MRGVMGGITFHPRLAHILKPRMTGSVTAMCSKSTPGPVYNPTTPPERPAAGVAVWVGMTARASG